jgi:hypothetical protein
MRYFPLNIIMGGGLVIFERLGGGLVICRYFNVKGVQINDPSINDDSTMIYCKHSVEFEEQLGLI